MFALYTAVQFVLIAVLTRCFYLRYFHPLSRYPGPFFASFTNLWNFFIYFRGEHHIVEQRLHEKYGPAVRVGPNSLSFSSLPSFEAIYGYHKAIEKGDFYIFARDNLGKDESVFSARTSATHREHSRKVFLPALSSSKLLTYEPVVAKSISVLLSRLAEARSLLKNASTGQNIALEIHRFTFDTMIELIYGESLCTHPYTSTSAGYSAVPAYRKISAYSWGQSLLPWLSWIMSSRIMLALIRLPTYDNAGNQTGISALITTSRNLLFTQPETALNSPQPSILRNYLQVPETDTKHMSPDDILRECLNFTFAGPGSTAAALTSILHELGTPAGQKWQDRIRADANSNDRPRNNSSALTAVIKESMRLHAPFPTAFPRTITPGAETAIPGLPASLPIGTHVSSNAYLLSTSTDLWGADAKVWNPARWLVPETERHRLEDLFLVFGKGPRGCIGRELAMLVLAEAVVAVLRSWRLCTRGELVGKAFLEMQYLECWIGLEELGTDGAGLY